MPALNIQPERCPQLPVRISGSYKNSYLWDMDQNDHILEDIKRIVSERYPSAKIYLYGSRAKGTASRESDWDLLILLNKEKITPEIEESITYPLYDLEFESGELISPMVYSEEEWNTKYKVTPFYQNIMQEGKLL